MPILNLAELFQSKVICENLVRIGWAFQELSFEYSVGGRNPLLEGLHVTCDAHFRTWTCYSNQKSCVKIWFELVEIGGMLSLRGAEDPVLGWVTCDLRCPFSNLDVLLVKSHVWKFGLDWLKLEVCIFGGGGGRNPLLGGVTCELRCPSSNLAELFQSKVMCENLVRIAWAFQEILCPQTNKQTYKHTNKHTNIQTNIQKKRKWSRSVLMCPKGAYNDRKHLKIWESALFSGYYMWLKFHQNRRYLIFQGSRSPLLGRLTIIEKAEIMGIYLA